MTLDGRRLAVLLASEVEGRTDGPLGPLSVESEHDPGDVTGSPEGERACAFVAPGRTVATLDVYPDRACLVVRAGIDAAADDAADRDVSTERTDGTLRVWVDDGGAVKRAASVLGAAAMGTL